MRIVQWLSEWWWVLLFLVGLGAFIAGIWQVDGWRKNNERREDQRRQAECRRIQGVVAPASFGWVCAISGLPPVLERR